ncbi:MAG: hypothetical protein AAF718_16725 [Pseudomonadota bacterium]
MPRRNKSIVASLTLVFFGIASLVASEEARLVLPQTATDSVELLFQQHDTPGDSFLQVYVGTPEDCCASRTPIVGSFVRSGDRASFRPKFPFLEDQDYTVVWRSLSGVTQRDVFQLKGNLDINAPQLTAIYPSGDVLPENTLRFYIHFSQPMQPHVAMDYISLVGPTGEIDDAALMAFTQELWSADRTRLTVLLDPGRIKRGVGQNLSLGPALTIGIQYSLVVKPGWPTATGKQQLDEYRSAFTVTDSLRSLPTVDSWQLEVPRAGTLDPLVIQFDRPFDREQLEYAIGIESASGELVRGSVEIGNAERLWMFTPIDPWGDVALSIVVDTRLEDVAGNNFQGLLDHDVGSVRTGTDQVQLSFRPIPVVLQ